MRQSIITHFRRGSAIAAIGLFFSGSFWLAARPDHNTSGRPRAEIGIQGESEEEDNDGDRVSADRPDEAVLQDIELTRDPATGTVPRERLLAAARYNAAMRARPLTGSLANATWAERGPTNVGGRILALLVDPADATGNTLWVGSAGGGLWKATNATTSAVQWTNVNSYLNNLAVSALAGSASAPQVMYCGTGEGFFNGDAIQGAGLWKTVNGGQTWNQLPSTTNGNFNFTQKLLVHPVTGDVYAATRTGLWRSADAGATWTLVLGTSTSPATLTPRVADLEIAADNTLFASVGVSSTDGIYRSATGAAGSWTRLNDLPNSGLPANGFRRIELATAPSDANRVYAIFVSDAPGQRMLNIYRSLDKGQTWAVVARPGGASTDFTNGQGWYDLVAGVSPTDPNTLYVGGLDLWLTNNAGETDPTQITWNHETLWYYPTTNPRFVHADQHAMVFLPVGAATGPANRAYFVNDGGVFYSDNAGLHTTTSPTFSGRNTGLNVTQYYAVAMHPTNFNYFLAGAQDNGTQRYTTAGLNVTTTATGGDGGFCAIDQLNGNKQFSSYVYNQYRRSTNGGVSFDNFNFNASKGYFINPFEYESATGSLYASYSADTCLVWTNAGGSNLSIPVVRLTQVAPGIGRITHVSVSPTVRKRIYVGTNSGIVLQVDSTNTATPVVRLLKRSSGASISCIAVDPANENHLLITYYNYGVVSVYETRDAGVATPVWANVEGLLPDMPVRWALLDPHNPSRALLATEMGVYCTELLNGSATVWVPANNSMPNTRIDMLRYRPGDQLVAAATHGRGLFTSDLFYDVTLSARAAFAGGSVAAYPNPFTQSLQVELATALTGDLNAQLIDALGRRVYTTTLRLSGRQFNLLPPPALAAGPYTLLLSHQGRQTSVRVMKQ